MSGEDAMNIIIFLAVALLCFCMFTLMLGWYVGIFVFLGVFIVSVIIAYNIDGNQHQESNEYFTDEDFIYAKVGEWVSRR